MNYIIGIDIAKKKFDVALLINNQIKHKVYENNHKGFANLSKWLTSKNISKVHACLESTGIYGNALAHYLYNLGHIVSIVNPATIKNFAQSALYRNKTDKTDAKIIAHFCQVLNPKTWQPEPLHIKKLQALVRRLDDLIAMQQQEVNRIESSSDIILEHIQKHIQHLDMQTTDIKKQIKNLIDQHPDLKNKSDLLESIPGIGKITISKILAFIGQPERFDNAKQLAAFVGLSPKNFQSGSSVRGKTRLCKSGNADLRCALYFPAIVAKRHNPVIKAFCDRLASNSKPNMVIICAAMRKLIHIIFGILKSGKPFNPSFIFC